MFTVAVNCFVVETCTLALAGETATVTGGGGFVTVTLAEPVAVGDATLVPCTVTAPEGTLAGAV